MSRKARVTFSYKAEQEDELTLEVGDIINNIVDTDVGWCEGELNGKKGMFPNNFVEEIVSSDNHADSVSGKKAKVTFDYDAQDQDELTLKVGDIVNVLGEEEAGWWKGKVANKTGVFPSNFVELIDKKDTGPVETQPKPSGEAAASSAEHLDGFLDEEEPEMKRHPSVGASSKKLPGGGMGFGANIISAGILAEKKLKKVHHDDKKEKKENSSVPSAEPSKSPSTVKAKAPVSAKSRPAPPVPQNPPTKKPNEHAKVTFSYQPENPDELKLVEGDIVTILNKDVPDSEGWWEGEVNGKVGMFPNNFVELLPAVEEDTFKVKEKSSDTSATPKRGVSVLPGNLHVDEIKESPKTHKKPALSVLAKDDFDSEKPAQKVSPKEQAKKPVLSHPPKEEHNSDHSHTTGHATPTKKPVAPQKPNLPPKKPLPLKSKKPDITGRKPELKVDTESAAPVKKTAGDSAEGSHAKAASQSEEGSKATDKKVTPEISTAESGEAPVSFDDLPQTETLNHLTANRAKVPQKRPPSKEGRLADSGRLSGHIDEHLAETVKQPPSRPKEPPKEPAWKRDAREAREKKLSLEEKVPPPILAPKTDALEKRKSVYKEEEREQTPPVQKVEPFTTASPGEVGKLRKEVSGLREMLEKMEKKFHESLKKQEEKFLREIEVLTSDFDEEKKQNAAEIAALKVEINILKRRQSRLGLDETR